MPAKNRSDESHLTPSPAFIQVIGMPINTNGDTRKAREKALSTCLPAIISPPLQ